MSGEVQSAEIAPPRSIYAEVSDPVTGNGYHRGTGLIFHAAEVPQEVIERAVTYAEGDGWERLIIEVQHLSWTPRVKWCSRYDGFGCDNEGEWHGHWFGCKHNPLSDCCHVVVVPVWPPVKPWGSLSNPPERPTASPAQDTP